MLVIAVIHFNELLQFLFLDVALERVIGVVHRIRDEVQTANVLQFNYILMNYKNYV